MRCILDAIHRLHATEQPEVIITDQGSYSDIVYRLFAICGYQFAPRYADISDTLRGAKSLLCL